MDCSLPGASVHGIFQAIVLEWITISFSRGTFPIQGSNPGLPHCRQIFFYQLSYQGSPLCVCKVGTYTDDLPSMAEHWSGTGKLRPRRQWSQRATESADIAKGGDGSGTPLQYSCLENPMDRGDWWAAVHGVAKSWTRFSN